MNAQSIIQRYAEVRARLWGRPEIVNVHVQNKALDRDREKKEADIAARREALDRALAKADAGRPDTGLSTRPGHREIIEHVAHSYGVTVEAIMSKSRMDKIAEARHAAIRAVANSRPDWSLTMIGKVFGRDHTTILHSLRKTKREGWVR